MKKRIIIAVQEQNGDVYLKKVTMDENDISESYIQNETCHCEDLFESLWNKLEDLCQQRET